MAKFIKPANYGTDCEPNFTHASLNRLKAKMNGICSIYVTGRGVLTFDGSMLKYHPRLNDMVRAAKWASLSFQPVLVHSKPVLNCMALGGHLYKLK